MERLFIDTNPGYDVLIGEKLLETADSHLEEFLTQKQVLIVSDTNIEKHGYVQQLKSAIDKISHSTHVITIEPGETGKSLGNVEMLCRYLATHHFSRVDYIVALGGGVVGDLAGFVAAIYLRGIEFVQIPTTFLAAIDSSVGGKTAVDIPEGKNLVGAFHQPVIVLCDTSTFQTLEPSIFEDGVSELIKYGAIMNPKLLTELIELPALQATDERINKYVKMSVEMKAAVVHEDEFDLGMRQLLNYGHTIGHAIEQATNYTISHGRAIAIGMVMMAQISQQLKVADQDYSQTLITLFNKYHLLDAIDDYDLHEIENALMNDKKRRSNMLTVVLPSTFGECVLHEIEIQKFVSLIQKGLKRINEYSN